MKYTGRLGDELTTEQGYQAARLTTINGLAQIRAAVGTSAAFATPIVPAGFQALAKCLEGYEAATSSLVIDSCSATLTWIVNSDNV